MRQILILPCVLMILLAAGCAPALIGGGAVGAYKVGTDERSMGRIWDDSAITAKVKSVLAKQSVSTAGKVDVDTLDGVVHLTGMLESRGEMERVVAIVTRVPEVKQVKNNLRVGSRSFGEAVDDSLIGGKIKSSLIGEPGLRSLGIDVDVNKGVVTLTGIVENREQKRRALAIAKSTKGVTGVVDFIKVTGN